MVDQERQKVSRPKDENAAVLLPSSKKRLFTGRLLERIDLSEAKGPLLAMQPPTLLHLTLSGLDGRILTHAS
jgi:hypothetical protein